MAGGDRIERRAAEHRPGRSGPGLVGAEPAPDHPVGLAESRDHRGGGGMQQVRAPGGNDIGRGAGRLAQAFGALRGLDDPRAGMRLQRPGRP